MRGRLLFLAASRLQGPQRLKPHFTRSLAARLEAAPFPANCWDLWDRGCFGDLGLGAGLRIGAAPSYPAEVTFLAVPL